jgi:hypothetical protein
MTDINFHIFTPQLFIFLLISENSHSYLLYDDVLYGIVYRYTCFPLNLSELLMQFYNKFYDIL